MKNFIEQYLKKHAFGTFSPKAVLFDMDGVIYNSMPNHAKSWHEAMASFGLQMAPDEVYEYEGMRGVETIKLLARRQWHRELPDEEANRMYAEKSRRFNLCPPPQKMVGITTLMQQIKADGLKIGIVTGSGQHSLLDQLEEAFPGLLHKELMVTSFDVEHGKPSPEPYQAGMRKAGTEPWQTVVVENAPLGVRAAVAAGCFTVAVNTGPLPDAALTAEGADVVLPSIQALSDRWASLLKDWQQAL